MPSQGLMPAVGRCGGHHLAYSLPDSSRSSKVNLFWGPDVPPRELPPEDRLGGDAFGVGPSRSAHFQNEPEESSWSTWMARSRFVSSRSVSPN